MTNEQQQVVETKDSVIVNACAGSGKTFCLTEFAKKHQQQFTNHKGLYIAYNASISEEMKKKGLTLEVMTSHGLALRNLFKMGYKIKPGTLSNGHIEKKWNELVGEKYEKYHLSYIKLKLESWSCSLYSEEEFILEINNKNINHGLFFQWLINAMLKGEIPIEHDLYLKIFCDRSKDLGYDYILLDESQDVNEALVQFLRKQNCLQILVGDEMQAIYQFRKNVNCSNYFDYSRLNLTGSFRNNNDVIGYANWIIGYVRNLGKEIPYTRSLSTMSNDTECIVCDTNFKVYHEKIIHPNYHIIGKYDWKTILQNMWDVHWLTKGMTTKIQGPYLKFFKDINHFYGTCVQNEDNEWLGIIKFSKSGSDIYKLQNSLDEKTTGKHFISTVHKAKGLEWNKVIVKMDHPFELIKGKKDSIEELNKLYVAITRGMTEVEFDFETPKMTGFQWKD